MRNSFPAHFAAALLVLACCALPLAAQDPRLQGKVVPAESPNNPPRLWSVKITVNNKLTHKEVEGEQRYTQQREEGIGCHRGLLFVNNNAPNVSSACDAQRWESACADILPAEIDQHYLAGG